MMTLSGNGWIALADRPYNIPDGLDVNIGQKEEIAQNELDRVATSLLWSLSAAA